MTRRSTTAADATATALAHAFLAGEWDPADLRRRGQRALGDRRVWLRDLAEAVCRGYPEAPRDRPRELTTFVAACPPFVDAADDPDRPLRVRSWVAAPTEMGTRRWPVPPIDDLAALARWVAVTPDRLAWFADRRSLERSVTDERLRHHHRTWVTKADGSGRLLESPKRELKDIQRHVLHEILDLVPAHDAAHGFRPGRSARGAVAPHRGQTVVMRLDLESFFACVTAGRVYGTFRMAGYPEPVAHSLAALCTTTTPTAVLRRAPQGPERRWEARRRMLGRLARPHLAQGAPTSPALANLAAFGLDRRVRGLADRFGAHYTRYADDLVLSGGTDLRRAADRVVELVAHIARDEGFRLNEAKTRVASAAQRQVALGMVVNVGANVPRADYDRLRAILHDAARNGPDHANREGHPDFRAHLEGRVAWAGAGSPARAARLDRSLAAIRWT